MKNLISAAVTILLIIIFLPSGSARAQEQEPGFCYTIINGKATVTGYIGEPEYINIPADLEGCPVTEVRDNAFYCCSSLKEIVLPVSITKLGHHCFYECTSLETISLPPELSVIGMGCFSGCTALERIELPGGLTLLPDSCFRGCTSLAQVYLPSGVRSVEKFCFAGCESLETAVFSEALADIGDYSFYMCPALKSVYVPPSAADIGAMALGFTSSGQGSSAVSGFEIFGAKGSAAEKYAQENAIPFTEAKSSVQAFAQISDSAAAPVLPLRLILAGSALFSAAIFLLVKQLRRSD